MYGVGSFIAKGGRGYELHQVIDNEILDDDGKDWHYVRTSKDGSGFSLDAEIENPGCNDIHITDKPRRFIVQQYTGYQDKNDVEIYEGDFVRGIAMNGETTIDAGEVKFGEYEDNESYCDFIHCGWYVEFKETFNPKYPEATLHLYHHTLPDIRENIEVIGSKIGNGEAKLSTTPS
jgi:hypothetical protein